MRPLSALAGRRLIYLLVFLSLSTPLLFRWSVPPARMAAADAAFDLIEALQPTPGQFVFLALDFGPSTIAENGSQAAVIVEHLMRRRIPFVTASLIAESAPVLKSIPEKVVLRLQTEDSTAEYRYGRDWVNLGYLAGGAITLQNIPKAESLAAFFKKDVRGNSLKDLPLFQNVGGITSVPLLYEGTGSPGTLEAYLQFFQSDTYRPTMIHGCTSIITPQAFIYLDSKQLSGLLEGIGGAAWYSERLSQRYPQRAVDQVTVINTGLGVAHLVILLLVVAGNLTGIAHWIAKREGGGAP